MNLSKRVGVKDIMNKIYKKDIVMRVDFNVPLKEKKVSDPTRISSTLETIEALKTGGMNNLVLLSHLGRPNGRVEQKYSLKPVVGVLEDMLHRKVTFVEDCMQPGLATRIRNTKDTVFLLENLRFHLEEEGKGVDHLGQKVKAATQQVEHFRQTLSSYGEVYVNDAFGTSHRAHSSIVGVDLPIKAAGLLLKKELEYFGKALEHPKRPLLVILGGAKVSDKIQLIDNILDVADQVIIGGGMAFTFIKTIYGMHIGDSKYDEEGARLVEGIMHKAQAKGVDIILPVDFWAADSFSGEAQKVLRTRTQGIEDGWLGLDCGPQTMELNKQAVERAETIIWNGPQGVFEWEQFAEGSRHLLEQVGHRTSQGALSIIGGGDTLNLVNKYHMQHALTHVSTGGGASLELLEGKLLPGIAAIDLIQP